MRFGDFIANGFPLVVFIQIYFVVFVDTGNGLVCRNNDNVQIVYLAEFDRFGIGRSGHTGKLFIHTEKILKGDCRERPVALGDVYVLFGFDGLVQSVAVAPAFQNTAGKFIYDLHLFVFNYVVDVDFIQCVRADRLRKIVNVLEVFFVEYRAAY